jgi:hypothetical protein
MKPFLISFLLFSTSLIAAYRPPFTVEAHKDASHDFPGVPQIQSFAFGQWQGRWVFIGGRIAGYHSVGGGSAEFLEKDANRDIWVVDSTVRPAKTYHLAVAQLPASLTPVKDQWTSAGLLYYHDSAKLYIAGGYGRDHDGKWVTFPILSQVDLPSLISAVMNKRAVAAGAVTFLLSPLVQSAGGELLKIPGGDFYLFMGHVFTGSYTAFEGQGEQNRVAVSQVYLNEIRRLKIECGPHGLTVRLVEAYKNEDQFHRRDFNAFLFMTPQGPGLAAFGGVFTPETQLEYSKPVYLLKGNAPVIEQTFDQKMNTYACARLLIYDKAEDTMHVTLFGGISRYYWDGAENRFVENTRVGNKSANTYLDGLQWSDQISTISKVMAAGREETIETVHVTPLPAFLGAEGVFIPLPQIQRIDKDSLILDLTALPRGKTLVGYIFGGIHAYPYQFPYNKSAAPYNSGATPSKPSEMVLEVWAERKLVRPE